MTARPKPIVLLILDGWGYRPDKAHNPCVAAETPFIDSLFASYPHRLIDASGTAVGLPAGQIGNSEVGHLHLGAGRPVRQDLVRINEAFEQDTLSSNTVLSELIEKTKASNNTVHILGLVSPGGVHSHENHIKAMIQLLADRGVANCYLHAFLDGRDVAPQSAKPCLEAIRDLYKQTGNGHIASLCGRYYAMDRDQRWARTEQAYDLLTHGIATHQANNAVNGLQQAYARGETDEFVQPTLISDVDKEAVHIKSGDVVLFMNFRADRARQLSAALVADQPSPFEHKNTPDLAGFYTLTQYSEDLEARAIFAPETIKQHLGEVLAQHGLNQLRLAETEKYAHVTYFFNGGNEAPYAGEKRQMVASPKVATYDLQPEMSATELTDQLCTAIKQQHFDVIICNYANPDMVGHTGIASAANQAMVTIDHCLQRVVEELTNVDGTALITADHGNIECIFDEQTQQPHTAHTTNPVPLLYIGEKGQFDNQPAGLQDVAPTLLALARIAKPKEMTGRDLLHFDHE